MAMSKFLIAAGGAVFLTLATLAGFAAAQAPGSGGPGRGGPPPGGERALSEQGGFFGPGGPRGGGGWLKPERAIERIFDRLDRNYDGVIDQAEFKSVIDNRFDRIDRAKKGIITAADLKARMLANAPPSRGNDRRNPEVFADRFVTRFMESFGKAPDGQVTKAEFFEAYLDVFKYINRAGDGRITRKEVEQYFNVARRMAPALRG